MSDHADGAAERSADALSLSRRFIELAAMPAFDGAPVPALDELAAAVEERRFAAGDLVVDPNTPADHLLLIVSGRAEATIGGWDRRGGTKRALAPVVIGEGNLLGAIVPPMLPSTRPVTITAVTDLLVLAIDATALRNLIAAHPPAQTALTLSTDDREEVSFLAGGRRFASLDENRLRQLALRMTPRFVSAGETIFQVGEVGDCCYLVRVGRLDLLVATTDDMDHLGTVGPGAVIGEEIALTVGGYAVTARAVEECELLALPAEDVRALLIEVPTLRDELVESLRLRTRPRQTQAIVVHHRAESNGQRVTILKDPRRHVYYRLTAPGWFLWQRLDGQHTIRELVIAYLAEFKVFAPALVAGEIAKLATAGFVERPLIRPEFARRSLPWWQRVIGLVRPVVEYRAPLPGTEALLDRVYRVGGCWLFRWLGQIALAVIAIVGLLGFVLERGWNAAADANGQSALILLPAVLVAIIWHELGHALTVKAFKRDVRLGIGWYWFGPLLYVDTSDMWLATKWPRIAVNLGGPYASLILASASSLIAWGLTDGASAAWFWLFALTSYIWVLLNVDPLLEYDGYYVLSDLLERPHLRTDALRWIGRDFLPVVWRGTFPDVRGHWVDLIYGLAAITYVVVIAITTVVVYRLLVESWIARVFSPAIATGLAWTIVAIGLLSTALVVIGDLRGVNRIPNADAASVSTT